MFSLLVSGQFTEAGAAVDELEPLSHRLGVDEPIRGSVLARSYLHLVTTTDFEASIAVAQRDATAGDEVAHPWRGWSYLVLGLARFFSGDWTAANADFEAAVRYIPATWLFDGLMQSAFLLSQACSGQEEAGDVILGAYSDLVDLPDDNTMGTWGQLLATVEALAVLGHRTEAAALYRSVQKGIATGVVMGWTLRLWQMVAGIAAGCDRQWDVSQKHFETALRQAHDIPLRIAQPEVRRWYAQMLLDRNAPGDRDKASTLLGEATEMYQKIGMPKHLEMVAKMSAEF